MIRRLREARWVGSADKPGSASTRFGLPDEIAR
jgi:hypothetical protein